MVANDNKSNNNNTGQLENRPERKLCVWKG